MKYLYMLLSLLLLASVGMAQNISINATGALPDESAMLDVTSLNSGILIPRLTTTQRDAIPIPANGLQIFNTTTKTLNVYTNSRWETIAYSRTSNIVYVSSLTDLPTPVGSGITLDATKMYIFSGVVNISPNFLNLNGASLRGTDPARDGVMSSVGGAVLRSTNVSIFIKELIIIPFGPATKAFDFADASGTKFCNIFSGVSVVEAGTVSLGVGQVSGFKAITIDKNYWNCTDGIKVAGNVGKFCAVLNFITNITAGAGIEFLAGSTIEDIDLANNYFVYTGQTGIKVNAGSTVEIGRLTSNMFRGVGTLLIGVDPYSVGWQMISNTGIPNTRAFSFLYMTDNATVTNLPVANIYYKIAGNTVTVNAKKFSATINRITYIGRTPIVGKVSVIIGGKAPVNDSDFAIVIAKNGVIIPSPAASMASASNNQSFQISFITELDLATNDFVEVFIRSKNGIAKTLVVEEMQFRITD